MPGWIILSHVPSDPWVLKIKLMKLPAAVDIMHSRYLSNVHDLVTVTCWTPIEIYLPFGVSRPLH